MDVLGFLAVGAAFLLFLSLLMGNGPAEGTPVQVIVQPLSDTTQGGSGLGVMVILALLLFFFLMVQAP